MARIRTIKPEFFRHPKITALDPRAQLLAIALLTMADDEGYFRAEPTEIRGQVMPRVESLKRVSNLLDTLCSIDWCLVVRHPEQGLVGKIAKWHLHQKVDHPAKSRLRDYFLATDSVPVSASLASFSRIPREELALEQGTGNREQGTGKGGGGGKQDFILPTEEEIKSAAAAYPGNLAVGTPPMIPVVWALERLDWGRQHPERWPGTRWRSWLYELWERKVQNREGDTFKKTAASVIEKNRREGDDESWWTGEVEELKAKSYGEAAMGKSEIVARLKEIYELRGGKGWI